MRIVIQALYVLAGLVGCSFLLSAAVLVGGLISRAPNQSDGMTAFGDLVGLVALFVSFPVHGILAIFLVASAEAFRVWAGKRLPS